MSRPRLLDLFCGAGGAAMGYHRAGFDVVGVDIKPQPRYPFEFIQADAMTYPLAGFDAIHASPPCQDHMRTPVRGQQPHGTAWMLDATRDRFKQTDRPWVIENVPGAPMRADLVLCACMFGLVEIERERWFETSPPLFDLLPPCHHPGPVINTMRTAHGPWYRQYGRVPTRAEIAAAMGIDWMRGDEIKQAIPPAYTEYIGAQLLEQIHQPGQQPAAQACDFCKRIGIALAHIWICGRCTELALTCGPGPAVECSTERSRAPDRQPVAPVEGRAWETPATRTV